MEQKLSLKADVKNYTASDILAEIKEDVELLAAIGYPEVKKNIYSVRINNKRARSLGRCSTKDKRHYIITVNAYHLKLSPAAEVHNTIMHEVIHSLPGCMNHGEKWKSAANKVNRVYDFPKISRCMALDDKEHSEYISNAFKYIVECQNCHSKYRYMREGKVVKACRTGRAQCSCGSKNFIVTENF